LPEILRASERTDRPWKNGGGSTADVSVYPPDATLDTFDWRVSIATISADGPFSAFVGVDRFLVPLGEAGLDLETADGVRHLERWQVFAFGGEDDVAAVGVAATSTDLNLMVRRQTTLGAIEIVHVDGAFEADAALIVVLAGAFTVEGTELVVGDAVRPPLVVTGAGLLAVCRATRRS
jgi:environmental stress-induced protein Ves